MPLACVRVDAQAGKWHGGGHLYGQVPSQRGFDSALTYLNGMEDHYTQVLSLLLLALPVVT